jgi:hypothetical protein
MVDSISVLPPGWRAIDQNGLLVTDGVLSFFDAGTNNPKIVYSDATLATALGVTVTCNSSGYPVSSGTNKTLIYVGSAPYKIRLTSVILGVTVFEHDNVKGSIDSSVFLTSAFTPNIPIVAQSSDLSVVASHKGKLINVNCTAGILTMSLANASTLGDGFWVGFRHDGTANQVKILAGNGTDIIGYNAAQTTNLSLTGRGQTVWLACDGVGFKIYSEVPALINNTVGIIRIADRLSAPPVSPVSGDRYILTAAPSGFWSTFAEHDIAEAGGNGWFRYTPPLSSGWVAYVQDEGLLYKMGSLGWFSEMATTSYPGISQYATQADMEAELTGRIVPPDKQRFHPAHPKFWAFVTVSAGVPTLASSYNVTSITDLGVGLLRVTIAADFSSANWAPGGVLEEPGGARIFTVIGKTAGTIDVESRSVAGTNTDPISWSIWGYGDQA